MPQYQYRVMSRAGQEIRGMLAAASVRDLRHKLLGQDYLLLEAEPVSEMANVRTGGLAALMPVRNKDRAIFSWQLYTMIEAGIPLARALESVARQTQSPRLAAATRNVVELLSNGLSFSEALGRHPRVFPPFFVHMVEVGEVGGVLDRMLSKVAEYYETQVDRRSRIVSAVSYPLVLLIGCIGILFFLVLFLMPRLFKLFDNMGAEMPAATRILLGVAGFLRSYSVGTLLALVGLVAGLKLYTRTPSGRYVRDRLLMGMPIVGSVLTRVVLSRFSHALAVMVNSGVPLLSALRVVREVVGNAVIERTVDSIIETVNEGGQVQDELKRHRYIPDMVTNMVAVGEETGSLGTMLDKVSAYYDREVNSAIKNLTKVVEPVLLVFMAGVVGFIAVSILDPITDLITTINR
ncbi:MAG: type II secretion system F family protein [Verrucomicrobia bacterium]|nr:type II secretion system F family protein [Verrucomicrobiota bacterium]